MFYEIRNFEDFNKFADSELACLFYFSHDECNVCKVLKPKIQIFIETEYPQIKLFYIDTKIYPQIAAQNSIFVNPTIIIFFNGNEFYRKSRNIGISELSKLIERPYNLMFK